MELLFESRCNLKEFTGQTIFVQARPSIHEEPVIRPDSFADRYGASIYGTVLRENGIFRMWYQAIPGDWDMEHDMAAVAYAESRDGLAWEKPALGLLTRGDEPNNLCDLRLHCPSVFVDEDAPPTHRYRALGYADEGLHMAPEGITGPGYYTAHSADGLRWSLDSLRPQWESGDVITSVYHPQQKRAIAAMKYSARVQRIDRRCIHTADFRDGQWSEAVSALYPDEYDDIAAMSRGYASCDYYGMGMMPAGSGTVGFLWNYWHSLPYVGKYGNALYGKSDVTLVYQAEPGGKWFHMPGRPSFIDHETHPWMNGWVYTASTTVPVGDEQRLYFTGMPFEHGFNLDPNWKKIPHWASHMVDNCERVIGFASWPQYRLFGVEAPRDASFTIDIPVAADRCELRLNYKTTCGGSVRAEIIDDENRSVADAIPLVGDETKGLARWKNGADIPVAGQSLLRVRLHLELATVFAYELNTVNP